MRNRKKFWTSIAIIAGLVCLLALSVTATINQDAIWTQRVGVSCIWTVIVAIIIAVLISNYTQHYARVHNVWFLIGSVLLTVFLLTAGIIWITEGLDLIGELMKSGVATLIVVVAIASEMLAFSIVDVENQIKTSKLSSVDREKEDIKGQEIVQRYDNAIIDLRAYISRRTRFKDLIEEAIQQHKEYHIALEDYEKLRDSKNRKASVDVVRHDLLSAGIDLCNNTQTMRTFLIRDAKGISGNRLRNDILQILEANRGHLIKVDDILYEMTIHGEKIVSDTEHFDATSSALRKTDFSNEFRDKDVT